MAHTNFDVKQWTALNSVAHSDGGSPTQYNAVYRRATEETVGVTRKKPVGWLQPTAYTYLKVDIDVQRGSCMMDPVAPGDGSSLGQLYSGVVGALSGQLGGVGRFNGLNHFDLTASISDSSAESALRNLALTAVRNKLKGTDINLGVAYGERNRTARLIGDTASRLARSIRLLRRGQIRNAMDELGISSRRNQPRGNNVPQRWLELQYGWKPLLSDVYGAASALENRSKSDWRVTAKATRSTVTEKVRTFTSTDASTCRARHERSVYARLDALPQNEAIISLASLGVTNPLSVAWELVPFSFVVDWFYPVGNFVSSLDATLGYSITSYSSSLLVRAEWVDEGNTIPWDGTRAIVNNFRGTKKAVYLVRQVSTSVPLPSLPGFKDPRSLGHMANGLALLAQVFGRSR